MSSDLKRFKFVIRVSSHSFSSLDNFAELICSKLHGFKGISVVYLPQKRRHFNTKSSPFVYGLTITPLVHVTRTFCMTVVCDASRIPELKERTTITLPFDVSLRVEIDTIEGKGQSVLSSRSLITNNKGDSFSLLK